MISDLGPVRAAIAAAVDAVTGLRSDAYDPATVSPPLFAVRSADITYVDLPPRAVSDVVFACRLYAGPVGGDRAAYANLDIFQRAAGPTSIVAALEVDRTLGGLVTTLSALRWVGDPPTFRVGTTDYIGSTLILRVT